MPELFTENLIPEKTLNSIFGDMDINWNGISMVGDVSSGGVVIPSSTLINPIIIGGTFKSTDLGARLEIFPEWDKNTGMIVYDNASTEVFKIIVDGTDVGDVIMGDSGTAYAKWDKSAGTFTVSSAIVSSPTITGIAAGSEIAIQGWQTTLIFSASDYRTVGWSAGNDETITLMDGTVYTFTAGNTGSMSALTYIYLDIAAENGTTTLQTTTTAATAVGTGKILVAVAKNNPDTTSSAEIQGFSGSATDSLILVDNLAANSTSTNEFVANTANIKNAIITDAKITTLAVSKLTAGTITSQAITLAITGGGGDVKIQGGKTDFGDTTSGFILGIDDSDSDKAKFEIGDAFAYMNWTGSALNMVGAILTAGTIRTAASGQRIEMTDTDDSFMLYDSSENEIFKLLVDASIITGINTISGSAATALNINIAGTGKGIACEITNAANTTSVGFFRTNGLGYSLDALVTSNASRTNPTVYINAVAGQGAHIGLFPIATAPQTPSEGEIYAKTDGNPYYHDGIEFVPLIDNITKEAGQDLTADDTVYLSTGGLDATKEEENTTGSSNAAIYGADVAYAQTFQFDIEGTITKLNLKLRKVGSPSGDVQVDMYAVDGNDDPTGGSLGTVTMTAGDLGTTYALEEFTFGTAIDVDASTTYIITCKAVDAISANRVEWQYANSGNPYASGEWVYTIDGGSSWVHPANVDAVFNVYAKPRADRLYKTDADFYDERTLNYLGFATESKNAGEDCKVRTGGRYSSLSGLTPGSHYYLSATAGGISTTVGTHVGFATSATELMMTPRDTLRAGHITISSLAYDSVGQGTWGFVHVSLCQWSGRVSNTSNGNGDNLSYKVDLPAGTYTLLVLVTTASSFGIVDVDIDGTEVASFDCYSAGDVNNVRKIETGIDVTTSGIKTLKLRVDGKNGSSSAYYIGVNYISLWRTA